MAQLEKKPIWKMFVLAAERFNYKSKKDGSEKTGYKITTCLEEGRMNYDLSLWSEEDFEKAKKHLLEGSLCDFTIGRDVRGNLVVVIA